MGGATSPITLRTGHSSEVPFRVLSLPMVVTLRPQQMLLCAVDGGQAEAQHWSKCREFESVEHSATSGTFSVLPLPPRLRDRHGGGA